MTEIKKLELAQRWFESIHPSVLYAYVDNNNLYIVIDKDEEYSIQVSDMEVNLRSEQFLNIS